MMLSKSFLLLAASLYLVTAAPLGCSPPPSTPSNTTNPAVPVPAATGGVQPAILITEGILVQVAPDTQSCDGATAECATAAQAAPLLNAAHAQFGINTKGEVAALVSLQMLESGRFRFQTNQGGNPGQGTRNMMNFPFMLQYALDTPSTKDAALGLVPSGTPDGVAPDVQNQVRALMLPAVTDFASAAWFYKTNCSPDVITGVQAATEAGWEAYITQCVGTTVTDDRRTLYNAVLAALG